MPGRSTELGATGWGDPSTSAVAYRAVSAGVFSSTRWVFFGTTTAKRDRSSLLSARDVMGQPVRGSIAFQSSQNLAAGACSPNNLASRLPRPRSTTTPPRRTNSQAKKRASGLSPVTGRPPHITCPAPSGTRSPYGGGRATPLCDSVRHRATPSGRAPPKERAASMSRSKAMPCGYTVAIYFGIKGLRIDK